MNCRSCHKSLACSVVDLGDQPLANALLDSPDDPDPTYPLHVYICDYCLLVQAAHTVPPETIYHNYPFRSAASPPWIEHCRTYAKTIRERYNPQSVLEIGSNDGTLLDQFDCPTTGVDPSCHAPRTIRQFFTAELAEDLYPADLVVANNVIGHVPNIDDFVAGLATVTRNVLTIETPWLYHLLDRVEYDTIYHEHFSYWSAHALTQVLNRHGLHIFDVEHFPYLHGGTIRYHISPNLHPVRPAVGALFRNEHDDGIDDPTSLIYTTFPQRVTTVAVQLWNFVNAYSCSGIGAPAKANTLLNTAQVTSASLPYTTDTTPEKHGKYLPGSHIPIYPAGYYREGQFRIVLAWNWWDTIIRQPGIYVHPLTLETRCVDTAT